MEDAARAEIFELVVGVDAAPGCEGEVIALVWRDGHLHLLTRLEVGNSGDRIFLAPGKAERGGIFALAELERLRIKGPTREEAAEVRAAAIRHPGDDRDGTDY